MEKIKILQLDFWMKHKNQNILEKTLENYDELKEFKKFGKPNIYLTKNKCWFELEDGRAFELNKETFKFKLDLLNIKELNSKQQDIIISAFNNIPAAYLSKKIIHSFHLITHLIEIKKK